MVYSEAQWFLQHQMVHQFKVANHKQLKIMDTKTHIIQRKMLLKCQRLGISHQILKGIKKKEGL